LRGAGRIQNDTELYRPIHGHSRRAVRSAAASRASRATRLSRAPRQRRRNALHNPVGRLDHLADGRRSEFGDHPARERIGLQSLDRGKEPFGNKLGVARRIGSSRATTSPRSAASRPRVTVARKWRRSMASSTVASSGRCSTASRSNCLAAIDIDHRVVVGSRHLNISSRERHQTDPAAPTFGHARLLARRRGR
jgi:hypothetical protein